MTPPFSDRHFISQSRKRNQHLDGGPHSLRTQQHTTKRLHAHTLRVYIEIQIQLLVSPLGSFHLTRTSRALHEERRCRHRSHLVRDVVGVFFIFNPKRGALFGIGGTQLIMSYMHDSHGVNLRVRTSPRLPDTPERFPVKSS